MIDVLLASYKPQPEYLASQIESIRAQKDVEVKLIVREDVDGRGACANFAALMEQSKSEYVAFSDQDDVWKDDKLSRMMVKMRELEARWGKDTPLLVFSDLTVVDADLKVLDESLFKRSRLIPDRILPRQLVLQNVANGNAMLFNAALREKARPIPPEAVMHDSWVSLVAAVFGHSSCLNESTGFYRQHSENVFGGPQIGIRYYLNRLMQGRKVVRERLYRHIHQAKAFVARYGDTSPECIKALSQIENCPYLVRAYTLLRHRIFKTGFLRNLITLLTI